MTPNNIIDYLEKLTPTQARTKAVREILSSAARAHQLNRSLARPMTRGRTILVEELPLTPRNMALYFDSLEKKDLTDKTVRDVLHAAGRAFVKLRERSGPLPKITSKVVDQIKKLYADGNAQTTIAKKLKIAQSSVSHAIGSGSRKERPIHFGKPTITSVILHRAKQARQRDRLVMFATNKTGAKAETVDVIISQMLGDGRLKRDHNGNLEASKK